MKTPQNNKKSKNTWKIPVLQSTALRGAFAGMTDNFKAFTLVELIVVITILVILGTIAFTSLTGYSSNARDSDRVTTLKNIESGLDIHRIKSGSYPAPENITGTGIVNNTVLSSVGTIGDTISRIIRINKTPIDPLTKTNYTYGTDAQKTQYQIATTLENPVAYHLSPLVQTVYADASLQARVNGNYPGYLRYMSGTQTYIANIPSLLFNNTGSTNLLGTGTYFIVNKQQNLPYKIDDKTVTQNKTPNEIIQALTSTQTATLTGVRIDTITTSTGVSILFTGSLLQSFGGDIIKMETVVLGKSTSITPQTPSSCTTQPTYASAIFTVGTPTQPNQTWQGTTSTGACYWTCGAGKTLVGNSCVSENCTGTDPNTINATTNATSNAGGTWNYNNTIPGLCTFACNSNYTWNGTTACTDQTAPINGSFTINNNATTTNSTSVTLNITCPTDAAGSTPIQVAFGNTTNPNSNWQNCTSSISHTLTTGDGTKTVYVRFRDSVGNVSGEVNDGISLSSALYSFTSHTFTNCNQTGGSGPSTTQCTSVYGVSWVYDTSNFSVTSGIQAWTVPQTGTYKIEAVGAAGNWDDVTMAGKGGYANGNLNLTQGQTIYITVGQQGVNRTGGFNGGGTAGPDTSTWGTDGGGGGASDVRVSGNTLNNRVLVASGGGGMGGQSTQSGPKSKGGDGGGASGSNGAGYCAGGGPGATSTAGGASDGTGGCSQNGTCAASNGSFGMGGNGCGLNYSYTYPRGAGGGGGWYGGSGGRNGCGNSAGGGGSGYIGGVSSGTYGTSSNTGHGSVTITKL